MEGETGLINFTHRAPVISRRVCVCVCVCGVGSFIHEVYVYSKPSSGEGVGVGEWPLQPVANEPLL